LTNVTEGKGKPVNPHGERLDGESGPEGGWPKNWARVPRNWAKGRRRMEEGRGKEGLKKRCIAFLERSKREAEVLYRWPHERPC
jgi:hypothetical protein